MERGCCITQRAQSGALGLPRGVGWGGVQEAQEGGDIGIFMVDSHCGAAENNTTM